MTDLTAPRLEDAIRHIAGDAIVFSHPKLSSIRFRFF